jgi:putative addiction module component (TIGR02574 family)
MIITPEVVFDAALKLPADARAELADRLWSSLEGPADPEIMKAWGEEADRRMAAYRAGQMASIPGDEAWARIEARWPK